MITLISKDEGAGKNIVTVKFQETLGTKGAHELSIATTSAHKITQRFNGALSVRVWYLTSAVQTRVVEAQTWF
jgi:hypothetical protein